MVLNKYSIKLLGFLVLISFLGFCFFWSLYSSQLILTKLAFAIIFIMGFLGLIRYINKTNRDLNKFLETLQYPDYILKDDVSDLSYNQLNTTYEKITEQLKKAWLEKEQQQLYFKYAIENIPVGIIAFKYNGDIEFYNKAAKAILNFSKIENLQELGENGEELISIEPTENRIINIETHLESLKLLAQSAHIKISNKQIKLVTLQNIKTQLEESELQAWQKLIRVLTHEIMNSVSPIKSLTYSMQKNLKDTDHEINKESILKGLNAIETRSRGLLNFVESYKNLTQIPKPNYARIMIKDLIDHVLELLSEEIKNQEITIMKDMKPEHISIIADEKLISQVLINLFQNAFKALIGQKNKKIEIASNFIDDEKVIIRVRDNGAGIPADILDKIFVPFFSTTEGGSGIGLSFARQVMIVHNGRIDVKSKPGSGTVFSLYF
ncbi:MAG: ATP-binding protein [Bacteroidales bacterium]